MQASGSCQEAREAEKAVRYSFQHGEAILKFGFRVCDPPMIIRAKLARISETHPKTALILVQARLEQLVFHQKLKRSTCRKIGPSWSDFSMQSIYVFDISCKKILAKLARIKS